MPWKQDYTRPFSQSKNAVAYVKEQQLAEQTVVVDGYIAGPALCVYLEKKVWYLNTGGEGSFLLLEKALFSHTSEDDRRRDGSIVLFAELDKFLLFSNREIDRKGVQEGIGDFRFYPLSSFRDGILPAEDCYIYQAVRKLN